MSTFASYSLELKSPLHLGSRRTGVVAQTHRHAPGHLFVYALAAVVGMRRGSTPDVFAQALKEVTERFRFGPASFMCGEKRLDDAVVEQKMIASNHHVTLDGSTRSAVERAMFEVEFIHAPPVLDVRLKGGVWCEGGESIDRRPLREWLSEVRLGGEIKTGLGRVHCESWQNNAKNYPGMGLANSKGLRVTAGSQLFGVALDGVGDTPLIPWLGRRHDSQIGFGRRLSQAVLVRMHGRVNEDADFLPSISDPGLGCWQRAA
jgi:hypothetical protein